MSADKHLAALQSHWKRHKAFPPMAKLTEVLGLSSTGGVFKVLGRLTDAGYLEREEGRIAPTKRFFERPVLGQVRAGLRKACQSFLVESDVLQAESELRRYWKGYWRRDGNRTGSREGWGASCYRWLETIWRLTLPTN